MAGTPTCPIAACGRFFGQLPIAPVPVIGIVPGTVSADGLEWRPPFGGKCRAGFRIVA